MSVNTILQSYVSLAQCALNANPHVAAELFSQHLRDQAATLAGLQSVLAAWYAWGDDQRETSRPKLTYRCVQNLQGTLSTTSGLTLACTHGVLFNPNTRRARAVHLELFPGNSLHGVRMYYSVQNGWVMGQSANPDATLTLTETRLVERDDVEGEPVVTVTETPALPDTAWTAQDWGVDGSVSDLAAQFVTRFAGAGVCASLLRMVTETLNVTDAQDALAQLASQPGKLDISEYVSAFKQKVGNLTVAASEYLDQAIDMISSGASPFAILRAVVGNVASAQYATEESTDEQLGGLIPWDTSSRRVNGSLVIFTPQFWGKIGSFIGSALTVAGNFVVKVLGVVVAAAGGVISSIADAASQAAGTVAEWDADSKDDRYVEPTLVNYEIPLSTISDLQFGGGTLGEYLESHGTARLYTPFGNYYFSLVGSTAYMTHFFGMGFSGCSRAATPLGGDASGQGIRAYYPLYFSSGAGAERSAWSLRFDVATDGSRKAWIRPWYENSTQLWSALPSESLDAAHVRNVLGDEVLGRTATVEAINEVSSSGVGAPTMANAWAVSASTTDRVTAGPLIQMANVLLANMYVDSRKHFIVRCPDGDLISEGTSWYPWTTFISTTGEISPGTNIVFQDSSDSYAWVYYDLMSILAYGLAGKCCSWSDFANKALPAFKAAGDTNGTDTERVQNLADWLVKALLTLNTDGGFDYTPCGVVFVPGITQTSLSTYRCAPPSRTAASVVWSVIIGASVIAAVAIGAVIARGVIRRATRAWYDSKLAALQQEWKDASTLADQKEVYKAEWRLNLLGSLLGQGQYDVTSEWLERPSNETAVMGTLAEQAISSLDTESIMSGIGGVSSDTAAIYGKLPTEAGSTIASDVDCAAIYRVITGSDPV